VGGLGGNLLQILAQNHRLDGKRFQIFGLTEYPAWGTPDEVFLFHRLDGTSIAQTIWTLLSGGKK
jgi:transketolase C-terminal domain/subunit